MIDQIRSSPIPYPPLPNPHPPETYLLPAGRWHETAELRVAQRATVRQQARHQPDDERDRRGA